MQLVFLQSGILGYRVPKLNIRGGADIQHQPRFISDHIQAVCMTSTHRLNTSIAWQRKKVMHNIAC